MRCLNPQCPAGCYHPVKSDTEELLQVMTLQEYVAYANCPESLLPHFVAVMKSKYGIR